MRNAKFGIEVDGTLNEIIMSNRNFAKDLEERTKRFAIRIFKMSSYLPNTPEGRIIKYQISKSGSSVGANYREANRARIKPDFKSRIGICESEASETVYWLEIIVESRMIKKEKIGNLYSEACELLAIFTSIGKNTKL